jgi:cell volume regulation protein A
MPWPHLLGGPHAVPAAKLILHTALPLPMLMIVVGAIFLMTLLISRFSLKAGIPAILGVLIFGLAINPSVTLFDYKTIESLHTLSLSMLLFYAGLKTDLRSIRGFLEFGVLLAVGGVLISSLILGLVTWLVASPSGDGLGLGLMQMPLGVAMLVAACLGSTDAGATMSVLDTVAKGLPQRLRSLLEFESSVNDPVAILFLGLVVGLTATGVGGGSSTGHELVLDQLQMFFQKIGSGLLVGLILGYLAHFSLDQLVRQSQQLLILGIAIGLLSYGTADLLGGSGFIAAYVTGMFLSNNNYRNYRITPAALQETLLPFNTMTEIAVFLIFGLVMNPARLLPSLPEGLVVGLAMMLVARPLSVMVFQPWSPFTLRESLLLSWCGLRGAVPLALSFVVIDTIPRIRGLDPAMIDDLVRNAQGIVFTAVALNLLVQGMTLPFVCRRLGLTAGGEGYPGPLPS